MLTLLFITTLVFFLIAGRYKTGNLYNPLTFFVSFWTLWVVVSLQNPYGLYDVSVSTYLLVWLNIVSFSIGFLLMAKKIKITFSKDLILVGSNFLKGKLFVFVNLFTFVVLAYYYMKYSALLANVSGDMRDILYEGYLFTSTIEHLFYFTLVNPLVYLSLALTISATVMGSKNKKILIIALVNGVLLASIGGGRFVYLHMIFFLVISIAIKFYLNKVNANAPRTKTKKKWGFYTFVLLLSVFAMNLTTAKRMGQSLSISDSFTVFFETSLPQMVVYFVGPFRALDYFLSSNITRVYGHTFGRSTLGGLDELFAYIISFINPGSGTYQTANAITSSFTAPSIRIGEGTWFNAFYSSIMNFYMDGGVAFVIMISIIVGIVSGVVYNYCLKNLNLFTFTILVYTTYQLVASEFRWNYQTPATWVVLFILLYGNRVYGKRQEKKAFKRTEQLA